MEGRYSTLAGGGRKGRGVKGELFSGWPGWNWGSPGESLHPIYLPSPPSLPFATQSSWNLLSFTPCLTRNLFKLSKLTLVQSPFSLCKREGVVGIKQTKWETCNEKDQAKTFLPLTNKFLPSKNTVQHWNLWNLKCSDLYIPLHHSMVYLPAVKVNVNESRENESWEVLSRHWLLCWIPPGKERGKRREK